MKTIRPSIANPLRTDSPRYGERWRDRSTVGSGVIVNHVALSYNAFNQLIEDAQSRSGAVTGSTPKVGYTYGNGSGGIQERYSYSAFGLATVLTPGFTARAATTFAWNFLFHGQFRDEETGWDNYGFRYYLPWLGSWPTRDLIGETDSFELYNFTHNSPCSKLDLLGPQTIPTQFPGNYLRWACNDPAKPNTKEEPKCRPPGYQTGNNIKDQCNSLMAAVAAKGGYPPNNNDGKLCCKKGDRLISTQASRSRVRRDLSGKPIGEPQTDFHFEVFFGSNCEQKHGTWTEKSGNGPVRALDWKGDHDTGENDGYKECGKSCLKEGTDAD